MNLDSSIIKVNCYCGKKRQLNREDHTPCVISIQLTFSNPLVRDIWIIFTQFLQVVLPMVIMLFANSVSIYYLLKSSGTHLNTDARLTAAKTTTKRTVSFANQPCGLAKKTEENTKYVQKYDFSKLRTPHRGLS